jgi:RNA-directed DNA polymerase
VSATLGRSLTAKLLAVQRVSSNRDERTVGVDGIELETPAQKWQQAQALNARDSASPSNRPDDETRMPQ